MRRMRDGTSCSGRAGRRGGVGAVGLLVQHVRRPGGGDQGAVGAGGEPAAAPQRSDPEPGGDRSKAIAQQERDVFGQIADSRAKLAGAQTPRADDRRRPTSRARALARLLVVVENYPQLRSNETFNRLMDELAGTENRIAVERMRYNERGAGVQHARGGSSRRTSRPASSASRSTRCSTRRRRRSGAEGGLRSRQRDC